jgi:hypothetical protein
MLRRHVYPAIRLCPSTAVVTIGGAAAVARRRKVIE